MAHMTFRCVTECEMTLHGDSYQDIYLQFKDFQHGAAVMLDRSSFSVCPPETDQVFFKLEGEHGFNEISHFKGNFTEDIGSIFTADMQARLVNH